MITQSKGKILLSDERNVVENDRFRSINLFSFGNYQHPNKEAFGCLYVVNEHTLSGGYTIHGKVKRDTHVLLLPVVGEIEYHVKNGCGFAEAGSIQVLPLAAGEAFSVTNPYPDELVKYLEIWIASPVEGVKPVQNIFQLETYKLQPLFKDRFASYNGAIMKLNGRQEEIYRRRDTGNNLFAFVLQGALEVEYRLLHQGDGLCIWDLDAIEFEALSNDAILLILEIPTANQSQ
jgi:quercetin 2,3-dioxygenase